MKKLLLGFLFLCLPVMALAESKIIGGYFSPSAPILAPDGSQSALSYSFSSDINTGMYLKGADDLGFSTGGLLRLNIDSSGNVGLGINSPLSLMHIKANTPGTVGNFPAGQLIIQTPDDDVNSNVVITAYESDGSGNPDQQLWYIGGTSGANDDMGIINRRLGNLIFQTNNLERVRIDESGNLGIGLTNPDVMLDVKGFSQLGQNAPKIKMKKLTGTTGATEGSTITIAHGLTSTKILGFDVLVTADNTNIFPQAYTRFTENEFYAFIGTTNIDITLSATNSANLLSNAFTVLLTYEE